MRNAMQTAPETPPLRHTLTEVPRAGLEAARLALGFRELVARSPRGGGRPVLVLPGYGIGDTAMSPLRLFLRQIGYATPLSGIESNLDRGDLRIRRVEDAARFRRHQVDQVVARIEEIHQETGARVGLVGWSMGGLFALDASQRLPASVSDVVTLGSPFGDPRGTSMWSVMRWLSGSDVPAEQQDFRPWLDRAEIETTDVPVTVLYSETDGIVSRGVARIREHPSVRHREVQSSHLGFATNAKVFLNVAEALAAR
jgi:pimeloyl-ACP methyl ester carboxylesterase